MAEDRRLLPRLVTAERSMQDVRLPARAVKRIADRIDRELDRTARARRIAWIPMLTFVAGAALVLAFLAVRRSGDEPIAKSHVMAPSVRVAGPDCRHHEQGGALGLTGACEVSTGSPAMRIQTVAGAELDVVDREVRMKRGTALFDVDKVVGDPLRVVVPGGTIVVVGTRFRVVVDRDGGRVDLYEGALEFRADDGSVAPIATGQRFAFGMPATPAAPPEDDEPIVLEEEEAAPVSKPAPRVEPPAHASAIIEEVQRLRRSGDYERAAAKLRDALAERWPTRTAEVLSYELGTILARHLGDSAAACAHWRRHLQRFAASRYRRQIDASLAVLACD
jgi:transmembrane sensor